MRDKITIKIKHGPEIVADISQTRDGDLDISIGGIFGTHFIIERNYADIAVSKLIDLLRK